MEADTDSALGKLYFSRKFFRVLSEKSEEDAYFTRSHAIQMSGIFTWRKKDG